MAIASYLNVVWPKSCDCKHTEAKGVSGNAPLGKFLKLDVWNRFWGHFWQKKKGKNISVSWQARFWFTTKPYGERFSDITDSTFKHICMHVSQPDRPMSPSGKQYHLTHQVLGFVAASEGMAIEWTKIVVSITIPDGLFPWVAFRDDTICSYNLRLYVI